MNILVVGKFYQDSFGLHIAETLGEMGHAVFRFQPGPVSSPKSGRFSNRMGQAVRLFYDLLARIPALKKIESGHLFDICIRSKIEFTIVTHDFLLPDEVTKIRKLTCGPVVLWHPDCLAGCGKFMFLNAPFDKLFFKDPYMVTIFRKDLRKPAYYLPECCNPVRHHPIELFDSEKVFYECDITTAGNLYPNREAFFRNLQEYNVKIWGPPPPLWMDTSAVLPMLMNRFVHNEEKAKAFKAAKIVVNNLHPAEIWGINCRAFEIPACEGFELISWRPGISQLFEDGREVVSFFEVGDLREKVDFYMGREEERLAIAKAGKERAHADHTYEKRLTLLLDTVFGRGHGYPMPPIRIFPGRGSEQIFSGAGQSTP